MSRTVWFCLCLVITFWGPTTLAQSKNSGSSGKLNSSGSGGSCQSVKVDCTTHKMTIDNGSPTTVNCGQNGTTPTTQGKIGGPHRGTVVPDGVDIKAPGMGQSGGGKVFHTPNPKSMSGTPSGSNSTKGCVACSLEDLNKLKKCQGASLEIKGNGSSGRGVAGGGSGQGQSGGSSGQSSSASR